MSSRHAILIVEDEPIIAMMLEEFIDSLGYDVAGTADTLDGALALVAQGGFDSAIVDINLHGIPGWPVAEALSKRAIPFVIVSGGSADTPPGALRDVPRLAKPYGLAEVGAVLKGLAGTLPS